MEHVHVNFASKGAFRVQGMDEPGCNCPDLPKQPLLVCKPPQKEIEELLYGENRVIIRTHRQAEDFEVFRNLPSGGVRVMRLLLVRLTSWPCVRGHSWEIYLALSARLTPTQATSHRVIQSFHLETTYPRALFEQWIAICQRLPDEAVSETLHSQLICDVQDLATA
ncbi:unnamed protein product [Clonostachys solani]|uniref:Uncharacterized protein n=1 Tax=Clonostachys solani TaxID=160281 RepID=A0A9N9Z6P1_9HYPO|nr:unnamed protein product [Clonostachys solani]